MVIYTCDNKQVQYAEDCNDKLSVNCLMAHLISLKDILTPHIPKEYAFM